MTQLRWHSSFKWTNEQVAAYQRSKYASDPLYRERERARNREWFKQNQARRKQQHLRKTYGLTQEAYDALLDVQHNRCPICRRSFSDDLKPDVDHCHQTGRVRGLLCRRCNLLLGQAEDDADCLIRAAHYLLGE